MSGLKLIPFGQRKAELLAAETHLAKARCQKTGTASRVYFFQKTYKVFFFYALKHIIYCLHKGDNMRKILVLIFVLIFCGCTVNSKGSVIEENNVFISEETVYGDNMTVSRALAAKIICLLFFEDEKCTENHFEDMEKDDWYYDYANIMYEKSIMVGSDGVFYPLEPVTYLEAMKIIKRLGGKDVEYQNKKGTQSVSYNLWLEMTEELAKEKGIEMKCDEFEIISLGDGEDIAFMKVKTDKGILDYSGLWLESAVGRKINAYVKDEHIIAVKSVE